MPAPEWPLSGTALVALESQVRPDPRLAAEKLLRSVLPEDLCISMSAIGECEVQGKRHRYKLFKLRKTHCYQGDKTFSCCIELSDTKAPDTDRIIAEYLLILNDEDEYLRTANLTQISVALNGVAYVHRSSGYAARSPGMILSGILSAIRNDAVMHGRRWPVIDAAALWAPGMSRDVLSLTLAMEDRDFADTYDNVKVRFLCPVAAQFATRFAEMPNLFCFYEFDRRRMEWQASSEDVMTGVKLSLLRQYDIRDARPHYAVAAGMILR